MTGTVDPLSVAHGLLVTRMSSGPHSEDPDRPETVQAMQIALHVPKADPPRRTDLLAAAARAVVRACLDERVATDPAWRESMENWYGHLIRKVARRARNKQWADVQDLPGVTVAVDGAEARAFRPSAVCRVPPAVRKLQIQGTELPQDAPGEPDPALPTILVDAGLRMSLGKAAAQVGHASMLLAARLDLDGVRDWAERDFALNVREVPSPVFARHAAESAAVRVRDAGFTEVAPDSLTVCALPARPPGN